MRSIDESGQLTFSIVPIAPFRLDLTVWALKRRPQNMVDRWDGTTYRRVLPFDDVPVEVAVRQTGTSSAPRLNVSLTGPRLRSELKHEAKSLVEKMFGLQVDLAPFYQIASQDPKLFGVGGKVSGCEASALSYYF